MMGASEQMAGPEPELAGARKWLLVLAGLFLLIAGLLLRVWQVLFMGFVCLVLVPVCYWLAVSQLRRLSGRLWHVPANMHVGERRRVAATVWAEGLAVAGAMVSLRAEGGVSVAPPMVFVASVGRDWGELTFELSAQRRVRCRIGPLVAEVTDAMVLWRLSRALGEPVEVVVYPRLVVLPPVWHMAYAAAGAVRTAKGRGMGPEIHRVREWMPGDERRRICWRAVAKHRRLMVVEGSRELERAGYVWLDNSAASWSALGEEAFELAVSVAASAMAQAVAEGLSVGLAIGGDEVVDSGFGRAHLARCLEALAEVSLSEARPAHPPGEVAVAVGSPATPWPPRVAVRAIVTVDSEGRPKWLISRRWRA